jgi:tripartite-type tricarboxylate transporter receptor subunit TctC
VIERLYGEIQKALVSAEVRERLAAVGGEVTPGSTADFAMLIKNERARYEKLVREAKIKPD